VKDKRVGTLMQIVMVMRTVTILYTKE